MHPNPDGQNDAGASSTTLMLKNTERGSNKLKEACYVTKAFLSVVRVSKECRMLSLLLFPSCTSYRVGTIV
jgi:hypothetical protein